MAKKKPLEMFSGFVLWLLLIFTSLAIAGLFTSGTTANYPILAWFPLVVHTFIGWLLIILVLIGILLNIVNSLSK